MNKIVFPTDFSKDSLKALEFAMQYLGNSSTEYIFIYVYQIPTSGRSGVFILREELKRQAESDMVSFVKKIKANYPDKDLNITTRVLNGDLDTQCNFVADHNKADCIIMGSKGASGIKEVLIGSNTIRLVKKLKTPLFVVPFNFEEIKMSEFVLAFDGQDLEEKSSKQIIKFLDTLDIPIKVVHISTTNMPPISNWDNMEDLFKDYKFNKLEIKSDDIETGLQQLVLEEEGLLCMIRHKQSFWDDLFNRSDSRKTVMHAKLPVLVIPE